MKYKLINELYSDNFLANLLHERGIENLEEFKSPSPSNLQSPENLDNVRLGYMMLAQYAGQHCKIALVVDCDVDGYTSATVARVGLERMAKATQSDWEVVHYLHKGKEHGLSDVCDEIEAGNYDVVILPDASTNDYEYHERLGAHGSRVLVLDHHEKNEDAQFSDYAVIINNQLSDRYTNKSLSGVGVTWQFFRFVGKELGIPNMVDDLIDIVALGLIGDMMDVRNLENRYIISHGLNSIQNKFFIVLCNKQAYSIKDTFTPITIAFYIVPLINAMIRVGTQEEKERVFLALYDGDIEVECHKRGCKGELEKVSIESARECVNARAKQNHILDKMMEAIDEIVEQKELLAHKIIVLELLEAYDLPKTLNGLLAMKVANKYKRPTLVVKRADDGMLRGSIRNVHNSPLPDFKEFLTNTNLTEYVSGHANAAGIGIQVSNLDTFQELTDTQLADVAFNENYHDINFIFDSSNSLLEQFIYDVSDWSDTWGQQNDEPVVLVKNISLDNYTIMGKSQDTVKVMYNGIAYMFFKAHDFIKELEGIDVSKHTINVIGRTNVNEWLGTYTPQIFVDDYELEIKISKPRWEF